MQRPEVEIRAEQFLVGALLLGYQLDYPPLKKSAFLNPFSTLLWEIHGRVSRNRRVTVPITDALMAAEFAARGLSDEETLQAYEWAETCRAVAQRERGAAQYWLDQFVIALVRRVLVDEVVRLEQAAGHSVRTELAQDLRAARQRLSAIIDFVSGQARTELPSAVVVEEALSDLEAYWRGEAAPFVVAFTDFPRLQSMTGGLNANAMMSILADTKVGKTTFVSALMLQFMRQRRGLLVPTEMSGNLFYQRLIADCVGMSLVQLQNTRDPAVIQRVRAFTDTLRPYQQNVLVLDGLEQTAQNVLFKVEQMLEEPQGCGWVIVDSGSVLATRGRAGLTSDVSATARTAEILQTIANTYRVPVVVTWQIGRKVGARNGGKRTPEECVPRLHDAMWSSYVEQASSLVYGLMRYSMYVEAGEAVPAPELFPDGALTLHLLADRFGANTSLGSFIPYKRTETGLREL